ncbi:MAG: hypothetical protein HFH82_06815 [Lachnospiraceae bacterium]|nr:hypothetical protein [Lachnospiraceae bacterium]
MKKKIWSMLVTTFLFIGISSMRCFAEGGNEVRLDQEGTVTIISPSAAAEGVSSLQFSVTIDAGNAERVEFAFDQSNAKIAEYRYNKDEKKLNVYLAGTEALFAEGADTLTMGKVKVLDAAGRDVAATVSIVADSVQYVDGTELKTMEGVTVSDPVKIHDNNQGATNPPSGGDTPGTTNPPSGGDTPGTTAPPSGGDNNQGGNSNDDNDDDSDDGDDDNDSQNSGTQASTPSQSTSNNRRPGTISGTQIAGRPQGGNQGTAGSSSAPSSTPVPTPKVTATPTAKPEVTATPVPSTESSSSEAAQPSSTPESLPTGGSQDHTESESGTNWILIIVIIAVVLCAGVGVMAVVMLNRKPGRKN